MSADPAGFRDALSALSKGGGQSLLSLLDWELPLRKPNDSVALSPGGLALGGVGKASEPKSSRAKLVPRL